MRRSVDDKRSAGRRNCVIKRFQQVVLLLLLICVVYAGSLITSTYRLFLMDFNEEPSETATASAKRQYWPESATAHW